MAWTLQTAPGSVAVTSSGTSVTPSFTSSTAGTMLVAVIGVSSGETLTGPAGWILAESESGEGETQIWYYPGNPGSLTSAEFTWTGNNTAQAFVAEFNPNGAGVYANLTAGANGTSAETLTVTTAADPNSGDLGIAGFYFILTTAATVSWTTPASWTLGADYTADASDHIAGYYHIGVPSNTTLSVEGEVATTQTKLTGGLVTFSLVPSGNTLPFVATLAASSM
jgi:hypothetical protein